MKRLFILLLFILAQSSFGSENDILRYEFVFTDHQMEDWQTNVTLSNDQFLTVKIWRVDQNETSGIEYQQKISDLAFKTLVFDLIPLTKVELQIENKMNICKIFASPNMQIDHLYVSRSYSSDSNLFQPPIQLIDGPKGCWVRTLVSPANEYAQQLAFGVKKYLKVTALSLIQAENLESN